ncbi:MAG: hypothetical protein LBU15_03005 [Rickettsiales bacterium]|nr:hypothetical protein [Rickettsiales bacterium]
MDPRLVSLAISVLGGARRALVPLLLAVLASLVAYLIYRNGGSLGGTTGAILATFRTRILGLMGKIRNIPKI